MKMNKKAAGILLAAMSTMIFTGCGSSESEKKADNAAAGSKIVVISREDGSGTRGAFIELFGIEKKDADGKKIDHTTDNAAITNNTSVMMTTVAGNKDAIGYISLGSLNDTVKALKIDGAEASAANVKSGAYKIARPFNICTKDGLSEVAQDFVAFIMSKEGQEVVAKAGCIGDDKAAPYKGTKPAGKVVVAGSSSITPAMEKLKEAYMKINPAANIEIQSSDSTTGVKSAVSGICDIGMASRDLKKSELEQGLKATVIATDGIAVIVNKDNKVGDLKKEQVEAIFTGKILKHLYFPISLFLQYFRYSNSLFTSDLQKHSSVWRQSCDRLSCNPPVKFQPILSTVQCKHRFVQSYFRHQSLYH